MIAAPPRETIQLRPYQEEAIALSAEAYDAGTNRQLIVLPTGCHRAGQGILMHDGTIKHVEGIKPGDRLMGADNQPRTVLALARGEGPMMTVRPVKGEPWIVNDQHVLTLRRTTQRNGERARYPSQRGGALVDVALPQWQAWSVHRRHIHKLFRVPANFPDRLAPAIDPYWLGLILGDGTLANRGQISITNIDEEIIGEIYALAAAYGLDVRREYQSYYLAAHDRRFGRGGSPLLNALRGYGLSPIRCEERFIPYDYRLGSRETRRQILAGLLDTDGHATCGGFDYGTKSPHLAEGVAFIARSLGLAAYVSQRQGGVADGHYRVSISGECSIIPCRVKRKQIPPRRQKKDVLSTGFRVEPTGTVEPFYGFTLDGDGRYLLDDFTVTHNTGKTVVFSHQVRDTPGRALILVHRDELVSQTLAKLDDVAPWLGAGVVKAERNDTHARVIVGSVQTLARPNRLAPIAERAGDFSLMVVDECHHAPSDSYQRVMRAMGCYDRDDLLTVGYTATPMRADGVTLGETWQKIVYQKQLLEMILAGYLADLRAVRVRLELDLDRVAVQQGDLAAGSLGSIMEESGAPQLVAEAYLRHGESRKAIVFTPTVAVAHAVTSALKAAGVAAETVHGETPEDERRALTARFKRGETQVVSNCAVWIEGFDEPSVECIVLARPTMSLSSYLQMVGRGTRLHPGKTDLLILDCGAKGRRKLITPEDLVGLPQDTLTPGTSVTAAVADEDRKRQARELLAERPAGRVGVEGVNLFAALRWLPAPSGGHILPVPDGAIKLAPAGKWYRVLYLREGRPPEELHAPLALGYAQGVAEDLVRRNDWAHVVSEHAGWYQRTEPATDRQHWKAGTLGVALDRGCTKAEASRRIAEGIARKLDAESGAVAPVAAGPATCALKVGDRISHARFGPGTVELLRERPGDVDFRVRFGNGVLRQFRWSLARHAIIAAEIGS